jgi:alkylation response protein AidB-like acyl-CoA dehydrogenase
VTETNVGIDDTADETVDEFAARARTWLGDTFARVGDEADPIGDALVARGEDAESYVGRGRMAQRMLFAGGFAGISYPKEYGGLGLTPAHLRAFSREARGYDLAGTGGLFGMTLGMIGPTLLDLASEPIKARYLPKMISGDELWVQFLSEPTGGSDLAGAVTKATRDGDTYVINGSKIWTSSADYSEYGVCLVRTDPDVPKHRGLTMLVVPVDAPGLEVIPLRLVTGTTGFCQEFFDDVVVGVDEIVGEVNDGWTVASRLLVHERNAVGGGSAYHDMALGGGFGPGRGQDPRQGASLAALAKRHDLGDDVHARQLVGEAHVLASVGRHLGERVQTGVRVGHFPPPAGSLLKLFGSTANVRTSDITMELAGSSAVVWNTGEEDTPLGVQFLFRQATSILSGTSEIQRNIISERVLGLPRESAPDRDVPFSEVSHNPMPRRRDEH